MAFNSRPFSVGPALACGELVEPVAGPGGGCRQAATRRGAILSRPWKMGAASLRPYHLIQE